MTDRDLQLRQTTWDLVAELNLHVASGLITREALALIGAVQQLLPVSRPAASTAVDYPQPIETAPKDGTRFWGLVGDDAIAMFWHGGFGEFVSGFRRMTMAPGYTIEGHPYKDHSPEVHRPTQWMPLPSAVGAERAA